MTNKLAPDELAAIRARVDALETLQGDLSRVKRLGDVDWRLGIILNHTAYPLTDEQSDIAWRFVEHAPADIPRLLAHIEALEAVLSALGARERGKVKG